MTSTPENDKNVLISSFDGASGRLVGCVYIFLTPDSPIPISNSVKQISKQ